MSKMTQLVNKPQQEAYAVFCFISFIWTYKFFFCVKGTFISCI